MFDSDLAISQTWSIYLVEILEKLHSLFNCMEWMLGTLCFMQKLINSMWHACNLNGEAIS